MHWNPRIYEWLQAHSLCNISSHLQLHLIQTHVPFLIQLQTRLPQMFPNSERFNKCCRPQIRSPNTCMRTKKWTEPKTHTHTHSIITHTCAAMEYELNQFFLKTREWLCSFFVNFFSWSVSPFDWPLPSTFFSVLFFYIILTYIISHICQCSFSLCLSVWLNAQKYCALYNTMQIRVHDVQYIYCK